MERHSWHPLQFAQAVPTFGPSGRSAQAPLPASPEAPLLSRVGFSRLDTHRCSDCYRRPNPVKCRLKIKRYPINALLYSSAFVAGRDADFEERLQLRQGMTRFGGSYIDRIRSQSSISKAVPCFVASHLVASVEFVEQRSDLARVAVTFDELPITYSSAVFGEIVVSNG